MKREEFVKVAEEALDSLPEEFRSRIHNVAILVEDFPPDQSSARPASKGGCSWASFTVCQRRRKAFLMFRAVRLTSCFIRRTLKRSVPAKRKSAIKSAKR
jgi:hypothetical protein